MTKNVTKTEKRSKSSAQAQLSGVLAILHFTNAGYLTSCHYHPGADAYEVEIHTEYKERLEIPEMLNVTEIEERDYEGHWNTDMDMYLDEYSVTTLRFETINF